VVQKLVRLDTARRQEFGSFQISPGITTQTKPVIRRVYRMKSDLLKLGHSLPIFTGAKEPFPMFSIAESRPEPQDIHGSKNVG
jgi:hypothetical protein